MSNERNDKVEYVQLERRFKDLQVEVLESKSIYKEPRNLLTLMIVHSRVLYNALSVRITEILGRNKS